MRSTREDAARTLRVLVLCVAVLFSAGCSEAGTVEGTSIDGAPTRHGGRRSWLEGGTRGRRSTTTARDDAPSPAVAPGELLLVAENGPPGRPGQTYRVPGAVAVRMVSQRGVVLPSRISSGFTPAL
jgi:hypothetical protein